MKQLNYEGNKQKTYKELFENNPELYTQLNEDEALSVDIQFGKYSGMLIRDLIVCDPGYFNYIKTSLLGNKLSYNLHTYYQRIKLIQSMYTIERVNKLERWSTVYERRKSEDSRA